jgi:putative FmdB family regulatory protein
MPIYEFGCEGCGRTFDVVLHVADLDRERPKCPACGSDRVTRRVSTFYAQTSRKS